MKKSSIFKAACAAAMMAMASLASAQEERVLWFSIGDGLANPSAAATQTAINNALNFADANGFNAVSILTRYRANAYYVPNREFSTFANPEPMARADQFDTLQYTIDGARERGLRVYAAWSAFLVTDGSNTYPSFLDPNWRMYIYESSEAAGTYDPNGPRPMVAGDTSASGLWVDPGIPAVRDYTVEVLLDLVENYDIDGIVLDRIRYPGDSFLRNQRSYGYTPDALSAYVASGQLPSSTPAPNSTAFIQARRDSITSFLQEAAQAVHEVKPWVAVGATPIIFGQSTSDSYNLVYQYFPDWTAGANPNHTNNLGVVSFIMPQYYRDGDTFSNITAMNSARPDIANMSHQPLFRSFSITPTLAAHNAESICSSQQAGDDGWGFFAYSGLVDIIGDINSASTPCGNNLVSAPRPDNIQYDMIVGWNSNTPANVPSVSVNSVAPYIALLSWPESANADRYQIYRSTNSSVPQTYGNLITSLDGTTATHFVDNLSDQPSGTHYYRVVPLNSGNNRGDTDSFGTFNNQPMNVIVKSRPGPNHSDGPGSNPSDEYEESGTWSSIDSSESSTAPGNPAFGSRFTSSDNAAARFAPEITQRAFYFADYTTTTAASHNALVNVEIEGVSVSESYNTTITGAAFGNIWTPLNSFPIFFETQSAGGSDNFVRLTRLPGSTNRLNTDAIRFREVERFPAMRVAEPGSNVTLEFPTIDGSTASITFDSVSGTGGAFAFAEVSNNNFAATAGLDTSRLIDQSFILSNHTGFSFGQATVTLPYDTGSLNGLSNDASDLNAVYVVPALSTEATMLTAPQVSFDYGNNTVTITGVEDFSTWYIGSEPLTNVEDWMLLIH